MIWGQTGTRHGATRLQLASIGWLWSRYEIKELHDGDCKGADAQLYDLAGAFGVRRVLHPPTNPKNRAFCGLRDCVLIDEATTDIWTEYPYFVRDRHIVDASQVMVATPKQYFETEDKMPGGTWYTIYYTREQNLPLAIVWPNGLIKYERWNLRQL